MLLRAKTVSSRITPIALVLLAGAPGWSGAFGAPSARAATLVVGRGESAATVQRPGVHIDTWTDATLSASRARPQGVVLAWTEVTRAGAPRRWWWRTYTSWCSSGRCSRPVRVFQSLRGVRRTPGNTVTPWRVHVSADVTRDRAVVKAGIRWGSRWAIASRTRVVGRGQTQNIWRAGSIGITHTPDGRDWLSWNTDRQQIRIAQARDGRRLRGSAVGRGDTAQVRKIGTRWVMVSLGRTRDFEDVAYPVDLKTATSIAGLRRAQPTKLARLGFDDVLGLFGPDEGPLLAVWESIADVDHVRPVGHGAWIDPAGTASPSQVLPVDLINRSSLRSVPTLAGGLTLCSGGLTAPLGGALQSGAAASCRNDEVRPTRLTRE